MLRKQIKSKFQKIEKLEKDKRNIEIEIKKTYQELMKEKIEASKAAPKKKAAKKAAPKKAAKKAARK